MPKANQRWRGFWFERRRSFDDLASVCRGPDRAVRSSSSPFLDPCRAQNDDEDDDPCDEPLSYRSVPPQGIAAGTRRMLDKLNVVHNGGHLLIAQHGCWKSRHGSGPGTNCASDHGGRSTCERGGVDSRKNESATGRGCLVTRCAVFTEQNSTLTQVAAGYWNHSQLVCNVISDSAHFLYR